MAFFSAKHLGAGQFVPDDDQGQGRQRARWCGSLHAPHPGQSTGEALLVGGRLRPRDARAHPRYALVQPLLEHARAREKTPMARWTFISAPRRRPARTPTGSRRAPRASSKSSSVSTDRKSRCSTKRGFFRTSRGSKSRRGVRWPALSGSSMGRKPIVAPQSGRLSSEARAGPSR